VFYRITLTAILYLLSTTSQAFCTKPISVGFMEWPPYQDMSGTNYQGFDNDFVKIVTEQFACQLTFVTMPWDEQLNSIRLGKLELALGVTQTPERDKYAYFTDPYRQEIIKLFVLAKDAHKYQITSTSDLKNVNFLLGGELGFYYGKEFSALMKDNDFAQQVRMVIYTKINVEKLADNKLDAFIADQQVGQYYIEKLGYSKKIVALPVIINQTDVRVMVSKALETSGFIKNLNTAIGQTIKSEKYKLLESKYLKK